MRIGASPDTGCLPGGLVQSTLAPLLLRAPGDGQLYPQNMTWPFTPPIKPMKAKVKVDPPQGEGWVYEPKWDGFRMIAYGGDTLRLDSRNGKDLLRYFPELRPALGALASGTVIDG
jgi:ATP-dependent DNA ligase